tara:strand:- start:540 stop:1289 length:750 start_codon:yes stop_codon:yes gene_type:complete
MRHPQGYTLTSQLGMTLLEVMLAASLSLMLIGSLTTIYIRMSKIAHWQQSLLVHHRAAFSVMSLLKDEIALSGNYGCSTLNDNRNREADRPTDMTMPHPLEVTDTSLTVRYQSLPVNVLQDHAKNTKKLIVEALVKFHQGQLLLIADCRHKEIVKVNSAKVHGHVQVVSIEVPLRYAYQRHAELGELVEHQYSIEKEKLVRINTNGRHEVMVKNIEDLHFNDDGMATSFSFLTVTRGMKNIWVGYASRY